MARRPPLPSYSASPPPTNMPLIDHSSPIYKHNRFVQWQQPDSAISRLHDMYLCVKLVARPQTSANPKHHDPK